MNKEQAIENTSKVVEELKKEFQDDAIKDWNIQTLVNIKQKRETGHCLEMQVSTKYDYGQTIINDIKERLGADDWNIRVRRGQMFLRFFIHYND